MNIQEIKERTALAKQRTLEAKLAEEKRLQEEARIKQLQEEADYLKRLERAINYIKTEIYKAADRGENSYEYETTGDTRYENDIKAAFPEFKITLGRITKTEIVNYEMSEYNHYFVPTLKFYW